MTPPPAPVTTSPAPVMPAPPPVVTGARPGIFYDDKPNILFREYLYPENKYPVVPLNLIVFPKKPVTKQDKDKYAFICEMWRAQFYTSAEHGDTVLFNKVPFYWMVKTNKVTDSCDFLIENYDYARAKSFAVRKKLDTSKTYLICELPTHTVTMDISRLKKDDDLELAMTVWTENMRSFPKESKEIKPYDIFSSAKAVLGALGTLIAMK